MSSSCTSYMYGSGPRSTPSSLPHLLHFFFDFAISSSLKAKVSDLFSHEPSGLQTPPHIVGRAGRNHASANSATSLTM